MRKEGLYLCKVKGLKYIRYMLLMWDNQFGWLEYFKYYNNPEQRVEGWCGMYMFVKVVEVVQFVDENYVEDYDNPKPETLGMSEKKDG